MIGEFALSVESMPCDALRRAARNESQAFSALWSLGAFTRAVVCQKAGGSVEIVLLGRKHLLAPLQHGFRD